MPLIFSPITQDVLEGPYQPRPRCAFMMIQLIRGCCMGVAIFSEYTPAPTLANIFFEVALCNLLGKPVIIVKSEEAKAPSDFVRTEWISYGDGKKAQQKRDFSSSITSVLEFAKYYENHRCNTRGMHVAECVVEETAGRLVSVDLCYREIYLHNGAAFAPQGADGSGSAS